MKNSLNIFWNIYIKPYYYHIKNINISYPKIRIDLAKNFINKSINKENFLPFNNLEYERSFY